MASGVTLGTIDGQFISALPINIASQSTVPLVAASAGLRVRAYKLFLTAAGPVVITFQDGSTALSGVIPLASNETITLPMDGNPWFTSSIGAALNILSGSAIAVTGMIYSTQQP